MTGDGPPRPVIREPGWYRFTPAGWERITDAEAVEFIEEGDVMDLVRVDIDHEEVPLW